VTHWLRDPHAVELDRQLETGALFEEGWFDRASVAELKREHADGRQDHSQALWPILVLALWLDRLRGIDAR
jgi:hypothetical protein